MASFLEPVPTTTYGIGYKPSLILPRIKYHDFPFQVNAKRDRALSNEDEYRDLATHRQLQWVTGPGLGLGIGGCDIGKYLDPKPITQTQPPQDVRILPVEKYEKGLKRDRVSSGRKHLNQVYRTKHGDMDSATIDAIYRSVAYRTSTRAANEEASLPVIKAKLPSSVLEKRSDQVRLMCQRYEDEAADWQSAVLWDRLQTRTPVCKKTVISQEDRTELRRSSAPCISMCPLSQHGIEKPEQLASIYIRTCPGYSGFVPRLPPESPMEKQPDNPSMTSTTRASYKEFPLSMFQKQQYARQCPFAKTVTLTSPFNPYSKVGKKG